MVVILARHRFKSTIEECYNPIIGIEPMLDARYWVPDAGLHMASLSRDRDLANSYGIARPGEEMRSESKLTGMEDCDVKISESTKVSNK